jgi:SpoVK/Ycf46/Vps4 family AAA+-type ATPase
MGSDQIAPQGIRWIFQGARRQAPCLLVFEDLDSLITDNNRSFFLNEVDGLEDNDGLLMVRASPRKDDPRGVMLIRRKQIATTNHFDKLDPALSNRPSRFDRK